MLHCFLTEVYRLKLHFIMHYQVQFPEGAMLPLEIGHLLNPCVGMWKVDYGTYRFLQVWSIVTFNCYIWIYHWIALYLYINIVYSFITFTYFLLEIITINHQFFDHFDVFLCGTQLVNGWELMQQHFIFHRISNFLLFNFQIFNVVTVVIETNFWREHSHWRKLDAYLTTAYFLIFTFIASMWMCSFDHRLPSSRTWPLDTIYSNTT
jgi:hypothetical protein